MIPYTTIERLTEMIPLAIDYIHTGTVGQLLQSHAANCGIPIHLSVAPSYPIDRQAVHYQPESGYQITLAYPDHPTLNDWQGLHALSHLLLGDLLQDDPTDPPAHLSRDDPHER